MQDNELIDPTSDDILIELPGTAKKTTVNWQVIQALYHKLTGKTENIINDSDKPIQVTMAELTQLFYKIDQASSQYNVKLKNWNINVIHKNEQKNCFTSVNTFKSSYDRSINSPVEKIIIDYNFLVTLPESKDLQEYRVNIRLISGIIAEEEIEDMREKFVNGMIIVDYYTSRVKINYVDYTVASYFNNIITEWITSVSIPQNNVFLKYIRSHSKKIAFFLKYIIFFIVLFSVIFKIPQYLKNNDLINLTYFNLWTFVALFFGYKIGEYLSFQARVAFNNFFPLSFLSLNQGDKKAIEKAKRRKKRTFLKAFLTVASNIVIGLLVAIISHRFLGV